MQGIENNPLHVQLLSFLMECYEQHSLKSLIDTARKHFDNPIALYDATSRTIVASDEEAVIEDSLWLETIQDGRLSKATIATFVRNGYMSQHFDPITPSNYLPRIYPPVCPTDHCRRLGVGIPSESGTPLAWIVMFEVNHTFRQEELSQFRLFAKLIAPEIKLYLNEKANHKNIISTLLSDTIASDSDENSDGASRLRDYGWNEGKFNRICLITPPTSGFSQTLQSDITEHFEISYDRVISFVHSGYLVLIISNHEDSFRKIAGKELEGMLGQFGLHAAYSLSFRSVAELRRHYIHAMDCLERSQQLHDAHRVVFFEDYMLRLFIQKASRFVNIYDYCHHNSGDAE